MLITAKLADAAKIEATTCPSLCKSLPKVITKSIIDRVLRDDDEDTLSAFLELLPRIRWTPKRLLVLRDAVSTAHWRGPVSSAAYQYARLGEVIAEAIMEDISEKSGVALEDAVRCYVDQ